MSQKPSGLIKEDTSNKGHKHEELPAKSIPSLSPLPCLTLVYAMLVFTFYDSSNAYQRQSEEKEKITNKHKQTKQLIIVESDWFEFKDTQQSVRLNVGMKQLL